MILCREELAKDVNRSVFPGQQGGPLMHIIAAKAVALKIAASEEFRARQRQTIANARALAEGLVEAGVDVLTGGTDVHLVLVDLTPTGVFGKEAELRLEEVGITVNRNAIPFDERPPMDPSGLRIGTPALTTRGLVEDDMREIAAVIGAALGDDFDVAEGRAARAHARADGALPALPAALRRRGLSAKRRLRMRDEGLGRLHRRRAPAGAAADHRAPRGAPARGRGDRAQYGQTEGILERLGIPYTSVGAHGGASTLGKAGALAGRSARLWRWARGRGFDLALAHGSVDIARGLQAAAVPLVQMNDYEHAGLQRRISFRARAAGDRARRDPGRGDGARAGREPRSPLPLPGPEGGLLPRRLRARRRGRSTTLGLDRERPCSWWCARRRRPPSTTRRTPCTRG